jgi:uncharacterized protein (TIGR00369 family)
MKKHIAEAPVRAAFERALAEHEQDFGRFFLARLYGLEIHYTSEECRITFDLQEFMLNPQGGLHGGVTAFVLDVAMGHLLNRSSGAGATLEMKVQYVKAPKSGRMTVLASFVRHGRSISFLRAEMTDEQNEIVAFATSTWKSLKPR